MCGEHDFCGGISRRNLLTGAAATLAFAALPFSANPAPKAAARTLHLISPYVGEEVRATYWDGYAYVPEEIEKVTRIMRDRRADAAMPVDPRLLDLLYDLQKQLRTKEPFQVVCGYRSPATNRLIRRKGTLAAKESLHMQGQAIDIRLKSRKASEIRSAALKMQRGGVGYYPASNFVHVDTGDVRSW